MYSLKNLNFFQNILKTNLQENIYIFPTFSNNFRHNVFKKSTFIQIQTKYTFDSRFATPLFQMRIVEKIPAIIQ